MQVTKFTAFLTSFIQTRGVRLLSPSGIFNIVILGQE